MSPRERDGLVGRVRQMRRVAAGAAPAGNDTIAQPSRIQALEARVAHLEELLEGLQDSVHRESRRQSRRLTDVEARIDPISLAAALSRDARERGL